MGEDSTKEVSEVCEHMPKNKSLIRGYQGERMFQHLSEDEG